MSEKHGKRTIFKGRNVSLTIDGNKLEGISAFEGEPIEVTDEYDDKEVVIQGNKECILTITGDLPITRIEYNGKNFIMVDNEPTHKAEEKVDLRFCLNYVHLSKDKENTGEVKRIGSMHPQLAMKELGIPYESSIPQSIADQWWFLGCKASPEKLPPFLSVIEGGVSSHWK